MKITSLINQLHQSHPKLAQTVSFTTAGTIIILYSSVAGVPLWLIGAIKAFTGNRLADKAVIKIANQWININNSLINNILPSKTWHIKLPDNIKADGKYLLICNHQSWIDTSIIQYVSQNRLPLTRFFTKFELIYIPFIGQAFYFLDFPMMRRYSKQQIRKNPALKGRDIEEAKRACKLLKDKAFTLLNYLEGTRSTKSKRKEQQSPYQYLLKPKAGGFSLTISALGDQIDGILDMTIVYPDYPHTPPSYTDLWKGKINRLYAEVEELDMPKPLFDAIQEGKYHTDETTKQQVFAWLNTVWQDKDDKIGQILKQYDGKD